jgi:rhamnosyltransferase subunit B
MSLNCVLITRGTVGEVHPVLQLAKALAEHRHSVTVVSHQTFSADAAAEGIAFKALDTAEEHASFLNDGCDLNVPNTVPRFFRKHCLPKITNDYKILSALCGRPNSVLISRAAASLAELMISETLAVPVVRLFTAVVQQTAMHLVIHLVSSELAEDINAARVQLGFSPIEDWRRWLELPALQLGFWPDWFATDICDRKLNPVGFVFGGTSAPSIPANVPINLSADEAPVLITAGTGKFVSQKFFEVSLKACKMLGRKAVVVCQRPDLVPFASSESVTVLRWVPSLLSLIKEMSAVVHHGGTITAAEASAVGLPQLVLPVGPDRLDTATRLRRLGVADFIEQHALHEQAVADRLQLLLQSKSVACSCRAISAKIDTLAASRACDLIEQQFWSGNCSRCTV